MGTESGAGTPSHAELVANLRTLRRPGLAGLRGLPLPALRRCAAACGLCSDTDEADDVPEGVERLLERAVRRFGTQDALGRAAARSFGLPPAQDLRGAAAQDRRKAAAQVYGVSTETFRRRQETQVIAQLAQAVLATCREHAAPPGGTAAATPGDPASGPAPQRDDPASPFRIATTVADAPTPFVVHVSPVDLLRDIDILVSSENVYLEMSKTFGSTLSGALRRAGAVRNAAGELVDDVLARELAAWTREHGRPGLPVRPGTVAPTSSGALAGQGVRRIYHAAVAVPFADRNGYEVAPGDIARAVRESFALARAEREKFDPPLSSICFPLMGAGRGGVAPGVSAGWIGWAVHEELVRDPSWQVHLVIRNRTTAEAVITPGRHP